MWLLGSRAQAQVLWCMDLVAPQHDPPRPGIETVFPALASRFFTTEPAGKPRPGLLITNLQYYDSLESSGAFPHQGMQPPGWVHPCFYVWSSVLCMIPSLGVWPGSSCLTSVCPCVTPMVITQDLPPRVFVRTSPRKVMKYI